MKDVSLYRRLNCQKKKKPVIGSWSWFLYCMERKGGISQVRFGNKVERIS